MGKEVFRDASGNKTAVQGISDLIESCLHLGIQFQVVAALEPPQLASLTVRVFWGEDAFSAPDDVFPVSEPSVLVPWPQPATPEAPHSRACGIRKHNHGVDCHANCPTCHGKSSWVGRAGAER